MTTHDHINVLPFLRGLCPHKTLNLSVCEDTDGGIVIFSLPSVRTQMGATIIYLYFLPMVKREVHSYILHTISNNKMTTHHHIIYKYEINANQLPDIIYNCE